MSPHKVRAGLVAALAAIAIPGAEAQTRAVTARVPGSSSAPAPSREEARASLSELQGITARLQAAHNRAMEDPALRNAQQALNRDLKAAMDRVDPGLPAIAELVRRMEAEARRAQERGDEARVQELTREFAQIRQRIVRAQRRALEQPELAERARAFEDALHRRMLAVEPLMDEMLERSRVLQERLRGAFSSRAAAPPRPTP